VLLLLLLVVVVVKATAGSGSTPCAAGVLPSLCGSAAAAGCDHEQLAPAVHSQVLLCLRMVASS
jgi:hypothetical protein